MPDYRIALENLELNMGLGIHAEERAAPQRVVVSVWMDCRYAAAPPDDIAAVVDYDFLRAGIRDLVAARHFDLQETLVEAVAADRHLLGADGHADLDRALGDGVGNVRRRLQARAAEAVDRGGTGRVGEAGGERGGAGLVGGFGVGNLGRGRGSLAGGSRGEREMGRGKRAGRALTLPKQMSSTSAASKPARSFTSLRRA